MKNLEKLNSYDEYIQKALNSVNLSKIYFISLCEDLYYEELKLLDFHRLMYMGLVAKLESLGEYVENPKLFSDFKKGYEAQIYNLSSLLENLKISKEYLTSEDDIKAFNKIVLALRDLEELLNLELNKLIDLVES